MSYILRGDLLKPAEYVSTTWVISPEDGTPYKEILRPEYFAHVAEKLKPGDEIKVLPQDGSYFALLFVAHSGRAMVVVKELMFVSFEQEEQEVADSGYSIHWAGPVCRFRVTRKSDGTVVAEGSQVATRQMAEDYIRELERLTRAA